MNPVSDKSSTSILVLRVTAFIFMFYLSFSTSLVYAQPATSKLYDDFSQKYFTHLYNFEFKDVESMLIKIDGKHKLEKHLFKANYYFWRAVTGDSSANYFSLCKEELNQQISVIKQSRLSGQDSIFYNALSYSYLMRLELMNSNYLNAIMILDKSVSNFEMALSKKDKYEPFLFLSGMYNYFVAYTADKYTLSNLYLLLHKSGNKEKGIEQLKKCSASDNMVLKTESLYFLMKIYLHTEKNLNDAKFYAEQLLNLHPKNVIFHREYYLILLKLNNSEAVKKEKDVILSLLKENKQLNTYQQNYLKKLW